MFRTSHACVASSGQAPLQWTIKGSPPPRNSLIMDKQWESCGPDTLHATFKEGAGRSPLELAGLLEEFQRLKDLPTGAVIRDKGVSGFEAAAVDKAAGLRLDWTRPDGEGANKGFFCLQVKGEWFAQANGEATTDFLELLAAYGIYRVTRLDIQQTVCTRKYLTPWFINAFEVGALRMVGRRYFEPRGTKAAGDVYPAGATIYHGARTSERFARQYDKHKAAGVGPPRRRDEIEIKGDSCRRLWDELLEDQVLAEQQGEDKATRLHSFSKSAIRAYMPIRDTSRWLGKELPKNWAQIAEEPMNWAELFTDEARGIQPAPKRVTSLLKSYRYANQNFGAAVAATCIQRITELEEKGFAPWEAAEEAYKSILDDFVNHANEDRVHEFFDELKPSKRDEYERHWIEFVRTSASNEERLRDEGLE